MSAAKNGSDYLIPDLTKLKIMWMNRAYASSEEQEEASDNFDNLINSLLAFDPDGPLPESAESEEEAPGKPMSQMFLELMIELDSAVKMIPPKVAAYRDLLAMHGLDSSARKGDSMDGEDAGGRQGMAGINVADQGALEYHGALMHLASLFANAILTESQTPENTSSSEA